MEFQLLVSGSKERSWYHTIKYQEVTLPHWLSHSKVYIFEIETFTPKVSFLSWLVGTAVSTHLAPSVGWTSMKWIKECYNYTLILKKGLISHHPFVRFLLCVCVHTYVFSYVPMLNIILTRSYLVLGSDTERRESAGQRGFAELTGWRGSVGRRAGFHLGISPWSLEARILILCAGGSWVCLDNHWIHRSFDCSSSFVVWLSLVLAIDLLHSL